MAITFSKLLETVVPEKSKVDKDDNRFLSPASNDKKYIKDAFGSEQPRPNVDKEDMHDDSENFTVQDRIKKHKGAPLKEMDGANEVATSSSTMDDVAVAYQAESFELLDEVMDLLDDTEDYSPWMWKDLAKYLKEARDTILRAHITEEIELTELNENFKVGNFKLGDNSRVNLSKEDTKVLNFALKNTKNKNEMMEEVTANKKEFNDFLKFARSLQEDFNGTLDNLLEDYSVEELETLLEEDELYETDIYRATLAGAKIGANAGGKIGKLAGATGGAVYGGSIAGGAASIKKVMDILKKRKKLKKGLNEEDDPNNPEESITVAPALDSDPNTRKKKKINESQKPYVSLIGNKWEVLDSKGNTAYSSTNKNSAMSYLNKNYKDLSKVVK